MRLRKITLEGFQSYREREEVDLQDLSLTAIYGKNHAGKSTLISNALDFALYGRSRSDSIGDVISRGAPRVSVSVEFDLGDGTYRVTRSRTAKGSPEAILEVSDPREESGWRALTEKNPLFTDPMILDLLGMNAQTAAMTWMVHQNDYGAFCDLLPSKRRDVLADAFGLSKFADLAKRAESAKKATATKLDRATYDLDNTRSRIEALRIDGPFPDVQDNEIETQAKEAEEQADALAAQMASLGDNTEVKERHRHAQETLDYFVKAHEREVEQYKAQRAQMEQYLLTSTQQASSTKKALEEANMAVWSVKGHEEYLRSTQEAARKKDAEVESGKKALADAEAEFEAMRNQAGEIEGVRARAEAKAEGAQSRVTQHEAAIQEATQAASVVEARTEALRTARASADAASKTVEKAQQDLAKAETEHEQARTKESDLNTRIAQTRAKADAVWAQVTQAEKATSAIQASVDSGQGVCLACQRSLSDDEAHAQIHDQQEKGNALRREYDAACDEGRRLTAELEATQATLKTARQAVVAAQAAVRDAENTVVETQRQIDRLTHEISAAEALASTLDAKKQAASEDTAILTAAREEATAKADELAALRTRGVEARDALNRLRATVEQAGKDATQEHRQADAAQRDFEAAQALAATVEERQKAAHEATTALESAQASAEEFRAEPARDEERYAVLKEALDRADQELQATLGGEERRRQITQERASIRDRARRLWQEQQRRSQVATELTALQDPLKKAEASVAELTEKVETYGVLMDAFKPSGIPFMILSGVIEELNEEANEIISELGDDGLSVLITTASENKNGGTAEKVMVYAITSDGQANYAALSGSEQTRVALAIRLGLAQCIARRTGTPIQTIVMDECWGMFDDAGKRAVMNVLIRLSERFSVFSVSHIPDVTDSFPDSIEVEMSTGTSRATVHRAA